MRYFDETQKRAEIERLARQLCMSSNWSTAPDDIVCRGEPVRIPGGYLPDFSTMMPMWCFFIHAAELMFQDMRRQEELAAHPKGDPDAV